MLSTLAYRLFIVKGAARTSTLANTKSLFSTLSNQQCLLHLKPQVAKNTINPSRALRKVAQERAIPITPETSLEGRVTRMHKYGMLVIGLTSAAGVGSLCYYGLGMSSETGALERSMLWPDYVKDRIYSTYMHLAGSFGISAATAYAAFRSPTALQFFSKSSPLFVIGSFIALCTSSMLVTSIPYEPGFGLKQLAWAGHAALVGAILAPLSMLGGPAIVRAATYTAGIVGGLSAIAICAPSEKYLFQSAPLGIGLGVVCASTIGSYFLPPTSKFGLGLYGISLYGGLVVFSGLLLYNTQKTIRKAEIHPTYSQYRYDPINNSLHLYMDIINIFVRILALPSGQKRK